MKFETVAADTIKARGAFGKEAIFSPQDVIDAYELMQQGNAVSDGVAYDTAALAHNRAGVLRLRLMKAVPPQAFAASTQPDTKNPKKYRWFVRNTGPVAPAAEPATEPAAAAPANE